MNQAIADTGKRVKEMQENWERGASELNVAIDVVVIDVLGLKVQTRD
jgi:hypothetical protein